ITLPSAFFTVKITPSSILTSLFSWLTVIVASCLSSLGAIVASIPSDLTVLISTVPNTSFSTSSFVSTILITVLLSSPYTNSLAVVSGKNVNSVTISLKSAVNVSEVNSGKASFSAIVASVSFARESSISISFVNVSDGVANVPSYLAR